MPPSPRATQGGIYHGRIVLPAEYPFKPPTFSFLTVRRCWLHLCQLYVCLMRFTRHIQPNGRFEVNTKICLSISTHHPEHWQPSWSIRTALVALAAFFPTKTDGAIGALSYSAEERRALAAASRQAPPTGGQSEARAAVTRAAHERMLAAELRNVGAGPSAFSQDATIAAAAAALTRAAIAAVISAEEGRVPPAADVPPPPPSPAASPVVAAQRVASPTLAALPPPPPSLPHVRVPPPLPLPVVLQQQPRKRAEDDRPLLALAFALSVAIVALLLRRMLARSGGSAASLAAAAGSLDAHDALR